MYFFNLILDGVSNCINDFDEKDEDYIEMDYEVVWTKNGKEAKIKRSFK